MTITTRLYLTLAAVLGLGSTLATAQELNTQILLPDPDISPTSLGPWGYGKALLSDPLPSSDSRPEYRSLFLGTLADPKLTSTIYRIDPNPNAAPAFSAFSVTPLDARLRFVTKLAYNNVERVLYAAGDLEVQNTKPKSTSLSWLVRQSPYAQSGVASPWRDSEPPFVLAKGADSRAQGIAIDNSSGYVYVSGRANDSQGYRHAIIRRKAPFGSWEKVYDKVSSAYPILETSICYFPGSPAAPAAYVMVGNENNKWTILRSTAGSWGKWDQVDTTWSAANAPSGAKDITYDSSSGKLYVAGYRGTFAPPGPNGWIVRVSTDGGQNWSTLLDVTAPSYCYPDAVVTSSGSVNVLGQYSVVRPDGSTSRKAHLVRCTNPTDALSWQSSFAGVPLPFDETNCSESMAQAITADPSGAIFAAGMVNAWVDSRTSPAIQYPGANASLLRLTPP